MNRLPRKRGGTPHDAFFRNTFMDVRRARGLLRAFLPRQLSEELDWRTLRPCAGRFSDARLKQAETDLLFHVRFRGRRTGIYIVVEHKSGPNWRCVYDMLRYTVHFWDRWLDQHPQARRMPQVVTLVVHHGRRGWTSVTSLRGLFDMEGVPRAVRPLLRLLQPQFGFLLQDLSRLDNAALRALPLSALVKLRLLCMQPGLRQRPGAAVQALVRNADLMQEVIDSPGGHTAMEPVWSYLSMVSDMQPTALARTFATMSKTTKKPFKSTHDQIVEKAKAENREEILLRQLRNGFGPLPREIVARVHKATTADLDRWLDRVPGAATLREVFAKVHRRVATSRSRRATAHSS